MLSKQPHARFQPAGVGSDGCSSKNNKITSKSEHHANVIKLSNAFVGGGAIKEEMIRERKRGRKQTTKRRAI
jgi:hypothetical protein